MDSLSFTLLPGSSLPGTVMIVFSYALYIWIVYMYIRTLTVVWMVGKRPAQSSSLVRKWPPTAVSGLHGPCPSSQCRLASFAVLFFSPMPPVVPAAVCLLVPPSSRPLVVSGHQSACTRRHGTWPSGNGPCSARRRWPSQPLSPAGQSCGHLLLCTLVGSLMGPLVSLALKHCSCNWRLIAVEHLLL